MALKRKGSAVGKPARPKTGDLMYGKPARPAKKKKKKVRGKVRLGKPKVRKNKKGY